MIEEEIELSDEEAAELNNVPPASPYARIQYEYGNSYYMFCRHDQIDLALRKIVADKHSVGISGITVNEDHSLSADYPFGERYVDAIIGSYTHPVSQVLMVHEYEHLPASEVPLVMYST